MNESEKENIEKERVKNPTFRGMGQSYYAIFRVGKKFKNTGMVVCFEKHMQRETEVPNANTGINNEILIGSENITEDVEQYINGIKLRSNAVVARELLLTASPNFFRGLPPRELELWKNTNIEWLKKNFGENVRYAVLHKDESTWHIHVLIVPRFQDKKRGHYLASRNYFNGVKELRGWQDNYSGGMKSIFPTLNRGLKFSKAKHIEIRHFYSMVNAPLDEKNIEQVTAQAKNSDLLKIRLKSLQGTMSAYKEINSKSVEEVQSMKNNIKELKKDNKLYKQVIETLSEEFNIPQYAVKNVVNSVQKGLDNTNVLERKK